MRTFIAIEIPDDIKREMAKAQEQLRRSGADVGWTRPGGIHLTLKFLGEVPETRIDEILASLGKAVEEKDSFRLEVGGIGVFPESRSPRVVWIGLSGEIDRLAVLQASVEEALTEIGFEREERGFTPHLTLGRIKHIRSRDGWQDALNRIKDIRLPAFDVTAVSLMKSELKPSGAVYTELAKIGLK